ncbi:MAG: transcriptional regulator, TraR/DksA family [Deltaproteobacteria bacterium]|nr:transcriptional regulator, TraR/DksA family [Deltaproteobacteria bacterium]
MEKNVLDSLAQLLREQRGHFLQEFRRAEQGLDVIAEERESELEEHAQEEQTARLLTRLDDQTLHAVKEIDAALQKILDGAYGKCEACHKPIAIARLHSLPAARFCRRCAARNEVQPVAARAVSETPAAAPLPTELNLLSDNELTEAIREQLKEDGRIDLEELHVVCRKGVVYLSGVIPSKAEHQVVLQTLTDVMGLKEIVDHLAIEDLLWQTEKRTKEVGPEIIPRWQEPPSTEDIVESAEEDKEFVAPAKPTPSEE